MSDWDEIASAPWFEDLPDEARQAMKANHDAANADRRLLEKQTKQFQEQADRLAAIEAEGRKSKVETAFKDAGAIIGAAEFYPADAPLEADKIREWAEPKGFVAASTAATSTTVASPAHSQVGVTPGAAPIGSTSSRSVRELDAKFKTDPEGAARDYLAGMKDGNLQFDNPAAQAMADELRQR